MAKVKVYRSSDRTHLSIRWLKAERLEWERDADETASRLMSYLEKGDMSSAYATAAHIEKLRAVGITTWDARRAIEAFVLSIKKT